MPSASVFSMTVDPNHWLITWIRLALVKELLDPRRHQGLQNPGTRTSLLTPRRLENPHLPFDGARVGKCVGVTRCSLKRLQVNNTRCS